MIIDGDAERGARSGSLIVMQRSQLLACDRPGLVAGIQYVREDRRPNVERYLRGDSHDELSKLAVSRCGAPKAHRMARIQLICERTYYGVRQFVATVVQENDVA